MSLVEIVNDVVEDLEEFDILDFRSRFRTFINKDEKTVALFIEKYE